MGGGVVVPLEEPPLDDFLMEGKAKVRTREARNARGGRMKVRIMRRMPPVTLFLAMAMMERTSAAMPSGAAKTEPKTGPRRSTDREQPARQIHPGVRENLGRSWAFSMV